MALVHADPFAHYTTGQYLDIYSDGPFGAAVTLGAFGRSGLPGLRFTGDHSDSLRRLSLSTSGAICVMQGDLRVSASPGSTNVILASLIGSTAQCCLALHTDRTLKVYNGDSAGTLLATSSYVVPTDTFIHIGVQFTIANSGGSIVVHVWEDGDTAAQVVINATPFDTQAGGSATWDGFDLGAACAGTTDWANFVVMDGSGSTLNGLLGPVDVRALWANAREASALSQFTLSAGSDLAPLVDDVTADDDTTYGSTSTLNHQHTVAVDPVPYPSRTILGAQLYLSAKLASGTPQLTPIGYESASPHLGTAFTPGASYAYGMQPYSAMPSGAAFSTAAAFDALQWGAKLTAAGTARLTQVVVALVQERATGSARLLVGTNHTVSGDDILIAGRGNTVTGFASQAHGVGMTVIGDRSFGVALDGSDHELAENGVADWWVDDFRINGTSITGGVSSVTRVVGAVIGNGVDVITTGVAGFVSCPSAGTITKVRLLSSDPATTSGSIVVDIWKDTYVNYPPTNADSITASAQPTISAATKSEDATLTGWTTAVAAGDVFGFNVDSVTSLMRVTVELTVQE